MKPRRKEKCARCGRRLTAATLYCDDCIGWRKDNVELGNGAFRRKRHRPDENE